MTPKRKRCRCCRRLFAPYNSLVVACSPGCALDLAKSTETMTPLRKRAEAAERRERAGALREYRKANKTRPALQKEAQAAFNAWVRARDADKPCISCGRSALDDPLTGGAWDCGHYRSVGAAPSLRFDPRNAHKQCKHCNQWLDGNYVDYRRGLIDRIGVDAVEDLEGPLPPAKWTRDELREIEARYKRLLREIENNREAA